MSYSSIASFSGLTAGNTARLLTDSRHAVDPASDIFLQTDSLIKGATEEICLEMYGLDNPALIERLAQQSCSGVKVQLVTDPPAPDHRAVEKVKALERLQASGVAVRFYPVRPVGDRQAPYGQVDHVKLVIVDGKSAIIGGMNWGRHSPTNHDYDILVQGPVVQDMRSFFRQNWVLSGGRASEVPYLPVGPRPDGHVAVSFLSTGLTEQDRSLANTVHEALENASSSIHAELFVLSEWGCINALRDAHARGVDVRLILHPLKIGEKAVNQAAWRFLRRAGVPVRWYVGTPENGEKLHAKAASIDGLELLLGSANWSKAGFGVNREAGVEVFSPELARQFNMYFQRDWEASIPTPPTSLAGGTNGTDVLLPAPNSQEPGIPTLNTGCPSTAAAEPCHRRPKRPCPLYVRAPANGR